MKKNRAGMTLIVKVITRLTVGLILAYGFYIVLASSAGPGSGFAAGIIIALSFIHMMLAFGKERALKVLNQQRAVSLASLSAVIFLFTRNLSFSLVGELAVSVMVGTGLFAIFLLLEEAAL